MDQLTAKKQPSLAQCTTLMKAANYGLPDLAEALGGQNVAFRDFGDDARVLALRIGGAEVIVPQGTENHAGWWRNFQVGRRPVHTSTLEGCAENDGPVLGKAHRGIVESWQKMACFVLERAEGAEVIDVLGHSAGGMIGGMAATALCAQGHEVRQLVTCGKARWCNSTLGTHLRTHPRLGRMIRVVNDKDPMSLLPFSGSISGRWRHETGKDGVEDGAVVVYLDAEGRPSVDPDRWKKMKSRFRAGTTEPAVADLWSIPEDAVDKLRKKGVTRLDQLVGLAASALASMLGVPAPLAAMIRRQVNELAIGARAVGLFEESIVDHYIANYEHLLHACSAEVEGLLS